MSLSVMVLPSWPLPRSVSGSADGSRLTAAMEGVLLGLPHQLTLVMLCPGSEPLVEDITALALADRTVPVAGAPELVAAVVERGQVPRVQAAALGGSSGALAGTLHAARPHARFVGVTIPARADAAALEGTIAALRGALDAATHVVLVVPGDLGPTGVEPAPVDRDVAAELREGLQAEDTSRLAALAARAPEWAHVLAPVRVALGVVRSRDRRFVIHADALADGVLHVVGAAE